MARAALLLLLLLPAALAHICILDPHQRGPLNVTDPGDDSCYRRTDYCGGIPSGPPSATYYPGQRIDVTFQQNLNHWYPSKAGYFDLAISYNAVQQPLNASWTSLGDPMTDFPAHDMVWQTNFTFSAYLPHTPCTHCVLRVRYVSNNPDEVDPSNNTDAIFYNCADIAINSSVPKQIKPAEAKNKPHKTTLGALSTGSPMAGSCCTPPQWKAFATDGDTLLQIFYDATNELVRIDRYSDAGFLSTITNYSNSNIPEYVNYPNASMCLTYGGDAFYQWCYGKPANQLVYQNASISVWSNKNLGGDMTWATDSNCLPYMFEQEGSAPFIYDVISTTLDPSVFEEPVDCEPALGRGCRVSRRSL